MARSAPGIFVISLDFELHWGVRDHRTVADYRENLLGARQAIPALLDLFRHHDVHATWATVGFLFFDNKKDLLAGLPSTLPQYTDERLSPYADLDDIGPDEASDPFHYGASLLRLIRATPGQEIATHTFSHYLCLERGQSHAAFEEDLRAAQRAAQHFDVQLRSLVFPRNQVNHDYLEACARAGITAYRGNQKSWLYAAADDGHGSRAPVRRALRLLDAYLPCTRLSAPAWTELAARDGVPHNIPASRFLRPYLPMLNSFEERRLRRIESEMSAASRTGGVYHLWWHPHNFGANPEVNIRALDRLLRHFGKLRQDFGMYSHTMGEVAEILSADAKPATPVLGNA